MKARFYEFCQNNSGGYFDVDDKVCNRVIIEAEDEDQAIAIFKPLIIDQSPSCPCCGDRWSPEYADEIKLKLYEEKGIEQYCQQLANEYGWTIPDIRIYYLNGKVKEIFTKKQK